MSTITIPRGDDRVLTVNITKDGDAETVSGTLWFTVKEDMYEDTDADAKIQKSVSLSSESSVNIELTSTDTDLETGKYYCDVQLVEQDKVISSDIFYLRIIQDVTLSTES